MGGQGRYVGTLDKIDWVPVEEAQGHTPDAAAPISPTQTPLELEPENNTNTSFTASQFHLAFSLDTY